MNKLTIMNSQWPFHVYQISPTSVKMQTQFSFWKHKWINLQSRTSKGHSMITKSVQLLLRCKLHLIRLFCSRIYIIFWEEFFVVDIFREEKNITFQMFWQKSWNNKTAAILMWTHSGEECTVRNRSLPLPVSETTKLALQNKKSYKHLNLS